MSPDYKSYSNKFFEEKTYRCIVLRQLESAKNNVIYIQFLQ